MSLSLDELNKLDSYDFPGFGRKQSGKDDCQQIYQTADMKALFLVHKDGSRLIFYPTRIGVPAYYPLPEIELPKKISAVLMDLDGTSVKSEHFWIWVIQHVVIRLTGRKDFKFTQDDIPHVSGYSVSEHLEYCLSKHCKAAPGATLEKAREIYFEIVHRELQNVLDGKPVVEPSFEPAPRLKEFLLTLKQKGVKIGLVSSGLYEKSIPEIKAAFDKLGMGDPIKFYDAVVTAGFSVRPGEAATLGELEPKPHPWLYAETMHGLNVPRNEVVGMEDSGAGILSLISAGIPAIGISDGNIEKGGEKSLCSLYVDCIWDALEWMKPRF